MPDPSNFELAGPFSWTAPQDGTIRLRAVGAGQGGRAGVGLTAGGQGGDAADYAELTMTVTAGQVIDGQVGAGGIGGEFSGGWGANGGDTVVGGGLLLARGGGSTSTSTGDAVHPGTPGGAPSGYDGGPGGHAGLPLGGKGGTGGTASTPRGGDGQAPGGGGGGGRNATQGNGGNGAPGMMQIAYFDPTVDPGHYVEDYPVAGTVTWIPPFTGELVVETLAAGDGGTAGKALSWGGDGGNGGCYATSVVSVTKGVPCQITTGAGGTAGRYGGGADQAGGLGGDSTFAVDGTVTVRASTVLANCIGATINAGGIGGDGAGASVGGDGGDGALPLGGAGGLAGGHGAAAAPAGDPGEDPGGGGGGGRNSIGGDGGAGASGLVRLSYHVSFGAVVVDGEFRNITSIAQNQGGSLVSLTPYRVSEGQLVPLTKMTPDLTAYIRQSPSWVPAGAENLFNPAVGTFNWKSPNTANLRAALAAGSSSQVFAGDSITEGWTYLNSSLPYNFTADRLHAWPLTCRDQLAEQLGIAVGGTGYVRATSVSGTADPRWTGTTDWTYGGHYVQTSNRSATFVSDKPGDTVAIMTLGGGPINVTIDGQAAAQISAQALAPHRHVYAGLANTTHSVQISPASGTAIYLAGAEVLWSGGGLRAHNVAQGGSTASGADQTAWAYTGDGYGDMLPTYTDDVGSFGGQPDTVFVLLGGNDIHDDTSYDTIGTALEQIAGAFDAADTDIIMVTCPSGSSLFTTRSYEPYWSRLYQTCLDNDWPLIDSEFLLGSYSQRKGNGFVGDDYGHFSTKGARFFGQAIARAVLQPV